MNSDENNAEAKDVEEAKAYPTVASMKLVVILSHPEN